MFWWFERWMPPRTRAALCYRRGVIRARLGSHTDAIVDYTEVIDTQEINDELRAMALYNRALALHSMDRSLEAIEDLKRLQAMPGAAGRVKTEARRKLIRMERNANRMDANRSFNGLSTQGGNDAGVKSQKE